MLNKIFGLSLLLSALLTVHPVSASTHIHANPAVSSEQVIAPRDLVGGSLTAPHQDQLHINSFDALKFTSANCAAKASSLAASYGNAQVMSVTQNGNTCTIVIRVKDSSGGPSRIIKKTVSG